MGDPNAICIEVGAGIAGGVISGAICLLTPAPLSIAIHLVSAMVGSMFFFRGPLISEAERGRAVRDAAREGHLTTVQTLLANGAAISENCRGLAVRDAARGGHLTTVQTLLANGPIGDDLRALAVVVAAQEGHLTTVQALLANWAIDADRRGQAIEYAAGRGHLAIVEALLEGTSLHLYRREAAVLQAASSRHRDVLEFLLRQGPITERVRNSAVTQMATGAIRDILLMAPVISDLAAQADATPGSYHFEDALYTTFTEVKADPAHFLEIIAHQFPRRVVLTNNPRAIDLGGVTKQFISTLIQALCDKEVIARNDLLIPQIRPDGVSVNLENMGKFYSSIFERNKDRTDKFVVGNLFHPCFFELVKITLSDATEEEKLKSVARVISEIDPTYKKAADALTNPSEVTQAAYRVYMGDEYIPPGDAFKEFLTAAKAFGEGLSGDFKTEVLRQTSVTLMSLMQGKETTKEKLLEAIQFSGDTPDLLQKKSWVLEKINEDDVEWMKKFIFAITGLTTLPTNLRITINPSWRAAFELHTCFNSLDFPNVPMEKAQFLEALDAAITGQNYNIA